MSAMIRSLHPHSSHSIVVDVPPVWVIVREIESFASSLSQEQNPFKLHPLHLIVAHVPAWVIVCEIESFVSSLSQAQNVFK